MALFLALPVHGQVIDVPVISPATPVHVSLLGSLRERNSPIGARLLFHSRNLLKLDAEGRFSGQAAAAYLAPLRDATPLDRVAAGILSQALYDPAKRQQLLDATRADEGSPLRRLPSAQSPHLEALAKAAEGDADAAKLFDGAHAGASGVEEVRYWKNKLWYRETGVKSLGQGAFGIVWANPAAEGQVVKMTAISADAAMFAGATDSGKIYDSDIAATRHLAEHGVGPRLIADTSIEGKKGRYPVAVKERIYGTTVQRLIWDRAYTPEAHKLVLEMIERMAKARIRVGDMNPANIMIGRTLVDPTIRAYHVDGGEVGVVKPEETEEQLKSSLYHQTALFKKEQKRDIGLIETEIPLNAMLERGLRRYSEKTFLQKLRGFLKDAYGF